MQDTVFTLERTIPISLLTSKCKLSETGVLTICQKYKSISINSGSVQAAVLLHLWQLTSLYKINIIFMLNTYGQNI